MIFSGYITQPVKKSHKHVVFGNVMRMRVSANINVRVQLYTIIVF